MVPNTRLVFTWAWHSTPERESLVTITVAKDGEGAMLTLHHEQFFDDKARDGHNRGWTGTLDKLERYSVGKRRIGRAAHCVLPPQIQGQTVSPGRSCKRHWKG